jgi:hypothetical protein
MPTRHRLDAEDIKRGNRHRATRSGQSLQLQEILPEIQFRESKAIIIKHKLINRL